MIASVVAFALLLLGGKDPRMPVRWRDGYVPFSVPWADSLASDPRVVHVAAKWFPTYLAVRFLPLPADRSAATEYLWVRILDQDPSSGVYLGELVESPRHLTSVERRDNVLFRFRTIMDSLPSALPVGDSYLAYEAKTTEFGRAFVAGVSAYREVEFGRRRELVPDCRSKLHEALALADSSSPRRDVFHATYLLGRCHSEAYELDSSIAWYRKACALDSIDLDPGLSLLGDLSIRYDEAFRSRDAVRALAAKEEMRKLADRLMRHDTPDRRAGNMIAAVYACTDSVRARRRDPCNMMRFRR